MASLFHFHLDSGLAIIVSICMSKTFKHRESAPFITFNLYPTSPLQFDPHFSASLCLFSCPGSWQSGNILSPRQPSSRSPHACHDQSDEPRVWYSPRKHSRRAPPGLAGRLEYKHVFVLRRAPSHITGMAAMGQVRPIEAAWDLAIWGDGRKARNVLPPRPVFADSFVGFRLFLCFRFLALDLEPEKSVRVVSSLSLCIFDFVIYFDYKNNTNELQFLFRCICFFGSDLD